MAEELTCEVISQMAGVKLMRTDDGKEPEEDLDVVYSSLEGDGILQLRFAAEPRLFRRIAENIIGGIPEDEEEVREYAAEIANVLCGRFVSEVCRATHTVARFRPTVYGVKPEGDDETLQTVHFVSDRKERASFSWGRDMMDTLLKREMAMKHEVMVVDDSRVVYSEMKKMLADSDFEPVCFCRSGEEALENYETVGPAVVTMDIVMPGKDGLDTAEELLRRWPDARILMVSSLAYSDTIDRAKNFGAKGFLFKPFSREELIEALAAAMKDSGK